jgi:uncharacterized protein YwqG
VAHPRDRRGFLRGVIREGARLSEELAALVRPGDDGEDALELEAPQRDDVPVAEPRPSIPPSPDVLEKLWHDARLGRALDPSDIARTSVRLTRSAAAPRRLRCRLGGAAGVPPGFAWPVRDGRELAFLGQLDLEEIRGIAGPTLLPSRGLLLFFHDPSASLDRPTRAQDGCSHVVLIDDAATLRPDTAHEPAFAEVGVDLSREVTLPGAWSYETQALELGLREAERWEALRARLAEAQGVEVEDQGDEYVALHRVLGFPDDIGYEVAVECELASAGLSVDDAASYFAGRPDREAATREWRLLLQVSQSEEVGLGGGEFVRLYFCVREQDLRERRFDAVVVVRRSL